MGPGGDTQGVVDSAGDFLFGGVSDVVEAVDPESGLLRWQKELLDLYRALQAEVIVEERSMTRKELHGMARSIMSPAQFAHYLQDVLEVVPNGRGYQVGCD